MMKSRLSATVAGIAALMLVVTVTTSTASAHELKSNGSPSDIDSDHNGYFVWNDGHDMHLEMTSGGRLDDLSRNTLHRRHLPRPQPRRQRRARLDQRRRPHLRFRADPAG